MLLLPYRELTPRTLVLGFNGRLTLALPFRRLPKERIVLPAWLMAQVAQARAEQAAREAQQVAKSTSLAPQRDLIWRDDTVNKDVPSYRPPERRPTAPPPLADTSLLEAAAASSPAEQPQTLPRVSEIATPLVRSTPQLSPFDEALPPAPVARSTSRESSLDPRTMFRNRPKPVVGEVTPQRFDRVKGARLSDTPIADLVVVPLSPTFKASEQGVRALLTYFKASQLLTILGEKVEDEWTEIFLGSDLFSHQLFMDYGAAPGGLPLVAKGKMVLSTVPLAPSFGSAQRYFVRIELLGCRFERLSEAVIARMHSILYLKPQQHSVAHDPQRL